MSLLTCRHLSVSYDGKAVLSDLNFSVDEGDTLESSVKTAQEKAHW